MMKKQLFFVLFLISILGTSFAQDNKSKTAQDWQKEQLKEMQQLEADQNKEMQNMTDVDLLEN